MKVSPGFQASVDAEHPTTVITKKDRRMQLMKLSVVAFVSIATVALTFIDVVQTAKAFRRKRELTDKIQGTIDTSFVIHNLQKERGMTGLQFGFKTLNSKDAQLKLSEMRHETNQSIIMLQKRDNAHLERAAGENVPFRKFLEDFRHKIDNGETNVIEHLKTYREWITKLISTLIEYTVSENLDATANLMSAYHMLILSKEEFGMERVLGGLKFIQGKNFSITNTTWYNEKRVLAENYLYTGFVFSSDLKDIYTSLLFNTSHWMKRIEEKREILSSFSDSFDNINVANEWFELMTMYNDLLLDLQTRQARLIEKKVEDEIDDSTQQLVIRSLLLCFTLIVVPVIIVSLARVQTSFYNYTLSLFDKVGLEQARTDFLMQENSRHVENLAGRWRSFSNDAAASATYPCRTSNQSNDNKNS